MIFKRDHVIAQASIEYADELQHLIREEKRIPAVGKFANKHMFSDIEPYEIVKVISEKTIEVRSMTAVLGGSWKPKFHVGGFAGNCSNQQDQTYNYSSTDAKPLRLRKHKDGNWYFKNSKFIVSDEPVKFYDYNF